MKRAMGFLIVAVLIGGAVWIGLTSERAPAPLRVASVEELAQVLSERGLGCGHADRDVPGMLPASADYGVCQVGGHPAAIYVFEASSASLANQLEDDFKGGWVVGDNWLLSVHDGELAREVAELLGARAFHGPNPLSSQTPTTRCNEDLPFEPTYLPDGFRHEEVQGAFPGGRPPDDQSSIGGGTARGTGDRSLPGT